MDETIIKLVAQVIFGIAAIGFTIYSIIAIYSLNTYGRSRSVTTALSLIYSGVAAGLLSWGFAAIMTIE